jgi:hypothetical protein
MPMFYRGYSRIMYCSIVGSSKDTNFFLMNSTFEANKVKRIEDPFERSQCSFLTTNHAHREIFYHPL